jgi:NAD-dependent SIR2 family protein deacetylase
MEPAHKRRRVEHEDKIRQALRNNKLVIIVGAGITLSATHPSPPRTTWTGLIHDGLDYLQHEGFVAEDDMELNHYRKILQQENPNLRAVLRACGYLKDELDHNRQFSTWLNLVFGSLHSEVKNPEVLEILRLFHQKGAKLMTTNYDELLEHHCNLQRIRLSIPEDVRKYEQGTLDGVFHIHGSYQDPQEVVLDPISYYRVKISNDVQSLLKTFLGHNTVLFVGCGTGLEDPNFNALLDWASSREENIPNHHFVLAQEGDNFRYSPLIKLRYGTNHENLVTYLKALLEDQTDASLDGALERRNTATERVSGVYDFQYELMVKGMAQIG